MCLRKAVKTLLKEHSLTNFAIFCIFEIFIKSKWYFEILKTDPRPDLPKNYDLKKTDLQKNEEKHFVYHFATTTTKNIKKKEIEKHSSHSHRKKKSKTCIDIIMFVCVCNCCFSLFFFAHNAYADVKYVFFTFSSYNKKKSL